ncbi:hypothetical protein O6H91_02G022800 [Diphasiastrum complanatum]|nr:hypothetical protein O6H91_02G022800 [Diphasiastrum complanatum]
MEELSRQANAKETDNKTGQLQWESENKTDKQQAEEMKELADQSKQWKNEEDKGSNIEEHSTEPNKEAAMLQDETQKPEGGSGDWQNKQVSTEDLRPQEGGKEPDNKVEQQQGEPEKKNDIPAAEEVKESIDKSKQWKREEENTSEEHQERITAQDDTHEQQSAEGWKLEGTTTDGTNFQKEMKEPQQVKRQEHNDVSQKENEQQIEDNADWKDKSNNRENNKEEVKLHGENTSPMVDKTDKTYFEKDSKDLNVPDENKQEENKISENSNLQVKEDNREEGDQEIHMDNKTAGWETTIEPKVAKEESGEKNAHTGAGSWEVQKAIEESEPKPENWEQVKGATKPELDPEGREIIVPGEADRLQGKTALENNEKSMEIVEADESLTSAQNREDDTKLGNLQDLQVDSGDNQNQVVMPNIEEPDSGIEVSTESVEVEDYRDLIHEFSNLPLKLHETAGHVAQELLPEIHRFSEKSKNYFSLANQQIVESFLPFIGKEYAPLIASLISYGLLLLPLALVIFFIDRIRVIFSLKKVLLFANIYLAGYFATLTMASFILRAEPMSFFQKFSPSSFISLLLLQAMGYLLYLLLEIVDLVKTCWDGVALAKTLAFVHCLVGTLVGLHYYVTVFHRAMARKAPQTSWKIYGIYSTAFLVLCLLARTQHSKKEYVRIGDYTTDKKN